MKLIFRKNQVIISALAVMLAVAGYLTYATDEDTWKSTSANQGNDSIFEISDEDVLGSNQNVSASEGVNGNDSNIANSELKDIASLDQDASDILSAENAGSSNFGTSGETENVGASNSENTGTSGETETAGAVNTGTSGEEDSQDAVLTSGMTIADYMAQSKLDREQMRGVTKEALLEIINNDGLTSEEKQTAIDSLVSINSVVEMENATETLLKSKGFSEVIVSIQDNQVDVVIGKESLTDAEVAQIEDIVKRKTEMGVESIVISLVNMETK